MLTKFSIIVPTRAKAKMLRIVTYIIKSVCVFELAQFVTVFLSSQGQGMKTSKNSVPKLAFCMMTFKRLIK